MKNNTVNKLSKFSLSALINDNRILMVLSLVLAFVLWVWVAIAKSPETEKVITSVPVQINAEKTVTQKYGLEIFGDKNFSVDVTVKGKKYILDTVDRDDIVVQADVSEVYTAGIKTLQLKISTKDNTTEFEIASSSSSNIEVYFDTYEEVEKTIKHNISTDLKSLVTDDCLVGDVSFSKETVVVSGPATEINKIADVIANVEIDSVLEKTTTFTPELKIITKDGSLLQYSKINSETADITVTIPVLKVVTLPTAVEFKNAPSYFTSNPLSYSVYPKSVKVAVPVEALDVTKFFVVDTIDFSEITNSYNTFNVDASSVNSYKIMNPNVTTFKISINASAYHSKTVEISPSKIVFNNENADFNITSAQNENIAVTLIGTSQSLESIKEENVKIIVDTANKNISSDTETIQAVITVDDGFNCWAYGTYEVKVKVTAKE